VARIEDQLDYMPPEDVLAFLKSKSDAHTMALAELATYSYVLKKKDADEPVTCGLLLSIAEALLKTSMSGGVAFGLASRVLTREIESRKPDGG
jgi:hypothetical protein